MTSIREEAFWEAGAPEEARAKLEQALRLDLLGPESDDEILRESPLTRYTIGMLAPFGTAVAEEELDEEIAADIDDEESGSADGQPPISQALTPSSIGVSFLVASTTRSVNVVARWGDYELVTKTEEPDTVQEPSEDADTTPTPSWHRGRWQRITRLATVSCKLEPEAGLQRQRLYQNDDVFVEWLCRGFKSYLAISVFLVNRRERTENERPPADRWLFQPELIVTDPKSDPVFLPRDIEPGLLNSDADREAGRLLFRDRREFAVGHGCAASWRTYTSKDRAIEIRSDTVPTFELARVEPQEVIGDSLDMAVLATVQTSDDVSVRLDPLLDSYINWIARKQKEVDKLDPGLKETASYHLKECRIAHERMQLGVRLLQHNEDARKAFAFANRAMLLQRSHTLWARQRRRDVNAAPQGAALQGRWYPFQLAFILLNLPGLIEVETDERNVADLLWFPTGGGKTEAYLGLAAFAMALRRLRVLPNMRTDAGITVLMRYTLRLLTIQQFQRASTLLCACETLRLQDPTTWGVYRFSIGLWLGMKGTPNSHDEARQALALVQQDPSEEGANPCQLESCPWCGTELTPVHYWTDGDSRKTRVACPRDECEFSKKKCASGLPVLVVDEEIYHECPSMLIATVDKFAQMPWNGQVQALFGFVNRECEQCGFLTPATPHPQKHRSAKTKGGGVAIDNTERLAPPDLIIQDELHLISGPLGTLVGLYETAVDHLSTRLIGQKSVRPKVLASTATVRRAFDQVQSVFQRRVKVFPPPGLEPDDSFFAKELPTEERPGRLYLGICAPGKSMKTTYVRVASVLLSAGAGLRSNPSLAEPYSTTVSYFNSLRELGGAIRLMDDDVPARMEQLKSNGMPRRNRPVYVELTSRIRQEEIPRLLRRLEQRHDAPRTEADPLPLDAILASSMISVGVDVDRLGLMIIVGQPKMTSEYIQASSRVGRQVSGPGLVVALYNWTRPRDLSHYERFCHYHATLYRHVEAVSATPFSSRALDRGLRAVFVAMNRLGGGALSAEDAADRFDASDPRVAAIRRLIAQRADVVGGDTSAYDVSQQLVALGDEWEKYGQNPLRFGWRSPDPAQQPQEDVLLRVPEGGRLGHWPAPQSLREVEQLSTVTVLGLDAS
jgi:hypothetical protein